MPDKNSSEESPLKTCEKDNEEFKKQVEENIKIFSKIDLKSKNKDKTAYKEALEDAIEQLDEHKTKSDDLIESLNSLKKDDEPASLKEKEFTKRQNVEIRRIKDIQEKIEKLTKKLKQDLEKQQKADEKEDAKKQKNSNNSKSAQDDEPVKGLKELVREERLKLSEEIKAKESRDSEMKDNKKTGQSVEEVKGLKELMREEKKKFDAESQVKDNKKPGQTVEEVKGLKELMRVEKKKYDAESKAMLEKSKHENDLEDDDIEDEEDEEEEEDNKSTKKNANLIEIFKNVKDKEAKQIKNDEDTEEDEEEEEEEDDDEEEEAKASQLKNIVDIVRDVKKKDENEQKENETKSGKKPLRSETKKDLSQATDQTQEKKKSESIFFGLFKSKSSTSITKDIKKLDKEEAKTSKEETKMKDDVFREGDALIVVENFDPEYEDSDLRVKKDEIVHFLDYGEDDPNWIEVKNKSGKTGFVPIKNVKVYKKTTDPKPKLKELNQKSTESKRSGKELWSSAQIGNLKEKGLIESTSHQKIPENFTDSILFELAEDPNYSYEYYLKPKLTESNLNFKNLYWESKENKIRNKIVSFQKIFLIHKCTNIPMPSKEEMTVLSRKVRICLFDGESVLSNIHTIQGHLVGKDERNWIFEDEFADSISILDYSEFFVRINLPDKSEINPNLGILFELSIYCKINETNEEVDICCGWAHLPFFDPVNKQQIVNKSYDLAVRGGSILENFNKPSLTTQKNLTSISDIVKLFKESKIKFNVKDTSNQQFDTLNSMPDPLISSTVVAPFIKYYREQLGEELVAPLIEIGSYNASAEPLHDIFLATFPISLNHPDILDQVKSLFTLTKENLRRDEKNDNFKLRKTFIKIYNEACYPLLFHSIIPELNINNQHELESRGSLINRSAKLIKKDKLVEYLLDSKEEFEPFLIDELRFEILV